MGCMDVKHNVLNGLAVAQSLLLQMADIPAEEFEAGMKDAFARIERAVKSNCNKDHERSCYNCLSQWWELERALRHETLSLKTRKLVERMKIG